MDMVFIDMSTATLTLENGRMINKTGMELIHSPMAHGMRVNFKEESSTARGN